MFALFVLAAPFATIILFVRLNTVRQQLLRFTSLSVEVTDGLRRELQELKRQVETLSGTAAASAAVLFPPSVQKEPQPTAAVQAPPHKAVGAPATPLVPQTAYTANGVSPVSAKREEDPHREKEPIPPVTVPPVAGSDSRTAEFANGEAYPHEKQYEVTA